MGDWPLFGGQRVEMAGQSGANTYLVSATAHASAHTKGNYSELVAATLFPASAIMITFTYSEAPYIFLVDIAVGAAGFEQVIVPDLAYGSSSAGLHVGARYFFPISIPSGSRIAMRCQASTGGKYVRGGIHLFAGGFAQPRGSQVVECYGLAGSTRGTSIDPGGTINTKGTYSQITASLNRKINGLVFGAGNQLNDVRTFTEWLVDIAIGGADSEQVVVPNIPLCTHTTFDKVVPETTPFLPISIPAGSRIAVRAQCGINDATDRLFDAFVYTVS